MKKWKWIISIVVLSIICTACSANKEETKTDEVTLEEEKTEEVQKYTLYSETEEVGIEIGIPASFKFEQTEYSSESWLALQIPGKDEDSSTQLMMYLEADETIDVGQTMFDEIQYLLSANSDEEVGGDSSIILHGENYEWNCLEYELEGLEGYKFWSELENGSVVAGTIENIGNNTESFNIDEFIYQIDQTIAIE